MPVSARSVLFWSVLSSVLCMGAALPPPLPPLPEPQQPELTPARSRISFETTEHDFGDIFDEGIQHTEFTFTNNGQDPLIIGEVKSSCGCTVPELDKKIYQPGETGVIKVNFNPHGKSGVDSRSVTIQCNDMITPSVRLTIKSHVHKLLIVDPGLIQFGQVDKGQSKEMEVLVAGRTDDFKVTMATTNFPDVFDVKVMETKVRTVGEDEEQLRATRLLLTLKPTAPVAQHRAELTIRTNDPRREIERTQMLAQVLGDLAIVPPRLSFGRVDADKEFTREFRIQSRSGKPFKITNVEVRDGHNDMTFDFSPEDAKNPTAWTVTLHGKARSDERRILGQILVRTDVKGEESLEVRFNGFVSPG